MSGTTTNRYELRLAGVPEPDGDGGPRDTVTSLAARWGVSKQAVSKMFRQPGAPKFSADRTICRTVAEAWRSSRSRARPAPADETATLSQAEAKRLQEVYRAQLLRIELDRERGDLVPVADVERVAAEDGATIRATLLAMPAALAPALHAAASSGVPAVAALLASWARDTLTAWASGLASPAYRADLSASMPPPAPATAQEDAP